MRENWGGGGREWERKEERGGHPCSEERLPPGAEGDERPCRPRSRRITQAL